MAKKISKTAPRRRKNRGSQSKGSLGHRRPLGCELLEDRRLLAVNFIQSDLDFILQQIVISEAHAAGADLTTLIPNSELSFGLRTVDGSDNNLIPGRSEFGAADNTFPRLLDPVFRDAENVTIDLDGPGPLQLGAPTSYTQTSGFVFDSQPRIISNLIVDQTANNPAAVAAAAAVEGSGLVGGFRADGTPFQTFFIPNTAPDEGLSAPFNSWMTYFGQFFDHGLDLVTKGGSGTVFMPLQLDDPLYDPSSPTNFMVLTRATNLPGPDGILGTADDVHEHTNTVSPFVDQNQTYASHASHQVFLRAYELNAAGKPVATGKLIVDRYLGADGVFGTADDVVIGGMATWATIKAQARALLGIALTDADVLSVPLLATDPYGRFLRGPNGLPQVVMRGPDNLPGTVDDFLLEGNLAAPISLADAVKTGHAFLDDIAHTAVPSPGLAPDADTVAGGPVAAGFYDNELLDAHYIAGDGRVNENIALTAVHHIFHGEHNRLVGHVKDVILQSGDVAFLNQWLATPVAAIPADPSTLVWNGERLFQAAKFGTEMQYQHLVFEEFARTIQPNIDAFLDFDDTVDPSILAEFAHVVYRFGHSMLTETIDRLDANFVSSEIGLIEAFLNPLEFAASGPTPDQAAGAIVRGLTRQVGNAIDEFVTEALRNNLLGLPLDLAAINLARGRDTGVPSLNAARRDFYQKTGDSQLRPYTSWADFVQHLKHPESLINFIAAYGTHGSVTSKSTLEGKREAATLLVLGGVGEPADRIDFLYGTGGWASGGGGVTITGLDDVDFWIGGLAERIMPFGGMLGSTFNFVFETQLEFLQNGDRLYYLHRLAGTNFLSELENNSFSKMVMSHTDVTHLPALIFVTPGLTLEVYQSRQFNAGLGGADPVGNDPLTALVIRDNPATPGSDTNYLRYTGDEHVVLGGTDGDDILIGSIGDDTLWGGDGNDRLEGGFGNDTIEGGPGDDIITDMGGDDVLKGGDGNDVIFGGQGLNLIIAGPGKDFIVTGEDESHTFAGPGDDFILGNRIDVFPTGNEGNDWIELGTQDGAAGDNFDPLGLDLVAGHDVFLGDGGFDENLGEGGDDIVVGSEGPDKHKLGSGFDWVTYKDDRFGVNADFFKNAFDAAPLPVSVASIGARYAQVEGLSGSAHADILRGDDADAAQIAAAGAQGSVLTNLDLITGLRTFLGAAAAGPDGIVGTADDQFGAGNIILGGDGSDIIEGRGGDDVIDGDRWLNVRISVRQNVDGTGPEIATYDSMIPLVPFMLAGTYNPGQLVIVREILTAPGPDFDTAMFSDVRVNYSITTVGGVTTVSHLVDGVAGPDGTDRLTNIERLQFADQAVILVPGLNVEPAGLVAILDATTSTPDNTPVTGQRLRASIAGVTDGDNTGGGAITGRVTYIWQYEPIAGSGRFVDISLGLAPRGTPSEIGPSFTVTPNLTGFSLRVKAHYQDASGVLETVFSAPTTPVGIGTPPPAPRPLLTAEQPGVVSPGLHFLGSDLQFILDQIIISERHAAGEDLTSLLPNIRMALGLRTVDGSYNNLIPGQTEFGAADTVFPRLLAPVFRDAEDVTIDLDGPGPLQVGDPTSYLQTSGFVFDSQPRIISNLIVDQTANNPAAVAAATAVGGELVNGFRADGTPFQTFFIPNAAPDEGLSASFNSWMTFFGQFFDHGLDLVTKGGSGTVFIPLQADDPLYNPLSPTNFMVLTRATNLPGPDGILGTADDIHEHMNTTSPFVDQNQTYAAHPAHQVFLRAYEFNADDKPVATGKLIVDRGLGPDGIFGTADDVMIGGMATWATVKAQARDILGIELTDADVLSVPLLATDPYGRFLRGPNGFPQVVMRGPDGLPGTADDFLLEGNLADPISLADAVKTGHAFLDDIARTAAPNPGRVADEDLVAGPVPDGSGGFLPQPAGTYDNELLDAHYIAGDGRVNENIGLTAVHHVFHSEHNRLVKHTQDVVLATAAGGEVWFLNDWLLTPVEEVPANLSTLVWNGERLFQAAKFGTEMQYQHLVFEEFARTIQPNIDVFIPNLQNYQTEIDPSIVAEFAHVVYRFGHSMLTETIDRLDADFVSSEIGLIQAFLNPLEFAASGPTPEAAAGAIVRGLTRQVGNEIDEFVTEALRNNLLGLPLDLASINLARGRDTGIPSLNAARRDFHGKTGNSQLAPYTSWADFVQHLKHRESLINFIAAYGTHGSITSKTTLEGKREAATLLVLGGAEAPGDRLAFLYSTGAWASGAGGVTTTGLDDVDFWIGGLAERIMPFGGMLGSTFNFVFENQLEALQNGDRFYYLERVAGLNFLAELENNSFAKMVMNATDVRHLPALIFQTNMVLEVYQSKQFNAGLGSADPVGADPLTPLVIRDNPATAGPDTNYLQYTGDEHVVLGGTDGDDILIGSIGDDTFWGGAGNDRIEGGFGNDSIRGGPGDDIITDIGGDDNIQGDDGNDVIHGGSGLNLILGGFGKDFIVIGKDGGEAFGGPGDDFILGSNGTEQSMGGEGDDWLEGGLLDGSPGDNFDPLGRDLIVGNDVYIGSGLADIMNGEGGDDIMVGSSGGINANGDKYLGASGFDWATFKDDPFGVTIDLAIRALDAGPIPAAAAILARFSAVEGLSGSRYSDILYGDDADAAQIAIAGAQGSVLTNFDLIAGLRAFVGAAAAGSDGIVGTVDDQFGAGNIIMGGDGSDIIMGRGGDDLIDGDKWLNVRISVRQNVDGTGPEIASFDSMVPMVPFMLDGTYNPGQLVIVREILPGNGGFDTAHYAGPRQNYTILVDDNGTPGDPTDDIITVTDNVGIEGTDRLTNIERLQFADQAVVLVPGLNAEPQGFLTLSDYNPAAGTVVTVSAANVSDADGLGPIGYVWQYEPNPGTGIFQDIQTFVGIGVIRATGPTFTMTADLVGLVIRAQGFYQDGHGVLETVTSVEGTPVLDPIGDQVVDEQATLTFTATAMDPDIPLQTLTFTLDAASEAAGMTIDPATGEFSWTPTEAQGGAAYTVTITVTDDGTNPGPLSDSETFTITVNEVNVAPVLDPIGNQNVDEQVMLAFTATATDQDLPAQTLTYSLDAGAPTGAVIDAVTGLFSWTPTEADGPGSYSVTVRVTDDGTPPLDAFETFTITVNEVNVAPTLDDISLQAARNTPLTITPSEFESWFHDLDGDNLMTLVVVATPQHGSLYLNDDLETPLLPGTNVAIASFASLTYRGDSAYVGPDSFTWNASDGIASADTPATVSITVVGYDDILTRTSDGTLMLARSTGTNFAMNAWGKIFADVTWLDVQSADVNGDGLADVIGRLDSGQWYAALNTGTSSNTQYWGLWGAGVWTDVMVGDFNGDGKSDIVGRLNGTRWYVGSSTGTSFSTSYWGLWGTTTWTDVGVGDFNGDGRDDLVGRVASSGALWVSKSGGTRFLNEYWGQWEDNLTWLDVLIDDFAP